ncbi:hypothetical protein AMELA_G00011000 [Ameiurus melas]|uniref:Chemokine interleukin-8-like domain-containing protein n=1 Tax=Ameiurus melas TaxID=219545 RepID=A0A7J6BHE8_AMEME|nr:hypothetical protein AMELA_G00011000 [Ameiurus melas]
MSRVILVLGFVLIMAHYSDAMPQSLNSVQCCFKFFEGRIPTQLIQKVKKINSHCTVQGFIVTMANRSSICVRKNPW